MELTRGDIENLRHVGRSPACGPMRGGALLDLADRLERVMLGDVTDTERLGAIERMVNATTGGVLIHDDTPDWAVCIQHDDEVVSQGPDLRAALDVLCHQWRNVRAVLDGRK